MNKKLIVLVLFLIGCLILIEVIPVLRRPFVPLERVATSAAGIAAGRADQLRGILYHAFSPGDSGEVQILQSTIAALEFDRSKLASLEAENVSLKSMLSLKENQAWHLVATKVVGTDPLSPNDTMLIAAGRRDGVMIGAAVVDAHGLMLGVVESVGDTLSTAKLLSARDVKVASRVVGRDGMVGLLQSTDGLSLTLTELPKTGDLNPGDVVVTSAESPMIQPGIPVGTVISITGGPEDLWRQAVVGPFASASSADDVAVVLPNQHAP